MSLLHSLFRPAYIYTITLAPPPPLISYSIVDGRYNEQKHRLQECGLRSCLYIVEGLSLTGENTDSHSNSHAHSALTLPIFPPFCSCLCSVTLCFLFSLHQRSLGSSHVLLICSLDTLSHLLYFSPSTIGPIYFYKVIYSTSNHYFNPLPLDVSSVQARVCVQRSIENCTGDHSGRLCGIGLLSPLSSHAIPSLLYSALSFLLNSALSFLLYSALFFLCFSISSTALLSPLFSPNPLESSPFFSLSPPP